MSSKGAASRKKLILALLVALVLLLSGVLLATRLGQPGEKPAYGEELLVNGSFERLDPEGKPEGWQEDSYLVYSDVTLFETADGMEGHSARIINLSPNDARFSQRVRVQPDTFYLFSGYIRAAAQEGRGANLSVADIYVFSEAVFDTGGEWKRVELYGKTGAKQREVTLFARLGGYSGEATGIADFDSLSLVALKEVPESQVVYSWQAVNGQAQAGTKVSNSMPAAPLLTLVAVACTALLLWLARLAQSVQQRSLEGETAKRLMVIAWGVLAVAMVLRLLIAARVPGFPVDIGAFRAWAGDMAREGPGRFYLLEGHRDYPPGYMLVLWPIGLVGNWLGTGASEFLVKLPSIVCDLLIFLLLYKVAARTQKPLTAALLASLYLLNPLTYLAGAAWGQVDSLPSLLLILAVVLVLDKRWRFALPVYVLAVLMKPQALMAGPLGLLALVMDILWQKEGKQRRALARDALLGAGLALLTGLLVVLPFFNQKNGLPWLIGLYGNTMRYYHYASVNATNLYFLFRQNWVDVAGTASLPLKIAGSLVMLLPLLAYLFQQYKKGALVREHGIPAVILFALAAALAVIVPVTGNFSAMGTLLMASVYLTIAAAFLAKRSLAILPLLAGVMLLGFSVLGTMMHERYLFLSAALLTLAYIKDRDRRILLLLLSVTALCFLNTGVALDRGVRIGGSDGNLDAPLAGLVSDSAWLEYTLSFFSLPVVAFGLYLGLTYRGEEARQTVSQFMDRQEKAAISRLAFLQKREAVHFDRKDALLIALVSVLYAVIALVNLGSPVSPQTPWTSSPEQQTAILDLGEQRTFRLLFFGGVHWSLSEFQVEVSQDGVQYQSYPFQMAEGDLFAWRYLGHPRQNSEGKTEYDANPILLQGRYIRIFNISNKLTLMEVVAQDFANGENLPLIAADKGSEALVDEQDVFKGTPSWYNSMYFDEIYHARTAYEQRNGLLGLEPSQVYEISHPPFGKFLMTLSVMVFGMTPFGWRFAGAMAGILMLPGMYLIGKQLTRRRGLGLFAMLLMAFDFMHFTQTRIATIDSFVTLFILYAYFFMFRYLLLDPFRASLRNKLVPLALSGLMMGFAIASKWPGIYAGAGLAVLFFANLIRVMLDAYRLHSATDQELDALGEDSVLARELGRRWLLEPIRICLWCLLFFIAVPLVIYYLSYIPVYIASPGGLTIEKVIGNNIYMFGYHSKPGFGANHPYSSPWYSWPVIGKPMYFYAGGIQGNTVSAIWTFGNPLVWWGGLLGLLWVVFALVRERSTLLRQDLRATPHQEGSARYDLRYGMLMLSFLAQYLPWILVPRGTFIYHYFPSVPFIILCLMLLMESISRRFARTGKVLLIVLPVLAGLLFIAYFPYISGLRVPTAWVDALRWFPIKVTY